MVGEQQQTKNLLHRIYSSIIPIIRSNGIFRLSLHPKVVPTQVPNIYVNDITILALLFHILTNNNELRNEIQQNCQSKITSSSYNFPETKSKHQSIEDSYPSLKVKYEVY